MTPPRIIFLIGLPGVGKTTLGEAVTNSVGSCRFVDIDREIVRRVGLKIPDIFAFYGEEEFRALELRTLTEVIAEAEEYANRPLPVITIVATGGGTPCLPGAMEMMNSAGLTIRLEASEEKLLNRLWLEREKRPMTQGLLPGDMLGLIREKAAERAPFYDKCQTNFCAEYLDMPLDVDITAIKFVNTFKIPPH